MNAVGTRLCLLCVPADSAGCVWVVIKQSTRQLKGSNPCICSQKKVTRTWPTSSRSSCCLFSSSSFFFSFSSFCFAKSARVSATCCSAVSTSLRSALIWPEPRRRAQAFSLVLARRLALQSVAANSDLSVYSHKCLLYDLDGLTFLSANL